MLRVCLLVLASGCAPAVSAASATSTASPNPNRELAEAPPERAARLAPPFGRSAGVRRVAVSNDEGASDVTVVASVERD